MTGKTLPRRKKLIRRSLLWSCVLLLPALGFLYLSRPKGEAYRAGDAVEGVVDTLGRDVPKDHPSVQFRNVATESGINFRQFGGVRSTQLPEDMGSGAAWGDYDGDGDPDLYLVAVAGPLTASKEEIESSPVSNRLYRNNSDGTFTDVSAEAGVDWRGVGMGAAWGDYDGDGDLDLAVTTFGPLLLFQNRGDGTFSNIASAAGLGELNGFWTGASWGDFDQDGDLDLYICGYVQYRFAEADLHKTTRQYRGVVPFTLNPSSYPPQRNLLLRNDNGRFTEIALEAGIDNAKGRSLSAAWCDFNLDGRLDLYVANDISDNALFENLGNGKFTDVSHNVWVADYRGAMGLAVGDWDGDRDFDIFITHWLAQENALFTNLIHTLATAETKAGNMLFMDLADQTGLGQIALDYVGWGTSFFDFNNDGRLDLLVVNGSTFQAEGDPSRLVPMRDLLFWNRGEEDGFFEVGSVSGDLFKEEHVGRGAAFADYDGDGDIDVALVNHGEGAMLLRNDGGNAANWLRVDVRSRGMNRFGVGAIVQIEAAGLRQIRQLGSQPSYLSQNPNQAFFGLGQSSTVDRLTVVLVDGRRKDLRNCPVNRTLTVEFP